MRARPRRLAAALVALGVAGLPIAAGAAGAAGAEASPKADTACLICHGSSEWFPEAGPRLVAEHRASVHARAGISCQDCHGGNPDPALATDFAASMDPDYGPSPFRGAPSRTEVPAFCGRCHSDPSYMKRFGTDIRTDQERQYRTSRHGIQLAQGDPNVATCVDCHGVHGILPVGDGDSPVHPLHVAETCSHCHSDAKRMAPYVLASGSPLPVNQYALWRSSVHGTALLDRGDLSAPTCNDCHGDHGATPPGVGSLSRVCGQCHAREATLFRASRKHEGFATHDEVYLPAAGTGGCATCHPAPAPQASITTVSHFAECEACHSNHLVVRPNLTSLGPPAYPCLFCHGDDPGSGVVPPEPQEVSNHYMRERDRLLREADGRSGDELYDWLIDRIRELPAHTTQTVAETGGKPLRTLKPAFARLYERFRIGKTHFAHKDADGKIREYPRMRCTNCHADDPAQPEGSVGLRTSREQLIKIRELTSLVGRTERALLYAKRRGVQVQQAQSELDGAVDALIAQHALLHEFSTAPGSAFAAKHDEGIEHVRAASDGARHALQELGSRRRGLRISLILIACVLVALALKIRSLGRDEP